MDYYYINTEAVAFHERSSHEKWIEYGYAFTSGNYEKYGRRGLGRLSPGDILFMYANQYGVVAAGRVLESWDGVSYEGDRECDEEYIEYRIPVEWHRPIVGNPISRTDVISIVGWVSMSALQRIRDYRTRDYHRGALLLNEVERRYQATI